MKKLTILFFIVFLSNTYATNNLEKHQCHDMHKKKMMYLDFGMGIGTAGKWLGSSFALDAMSMGMYILKDLSLEVGMGMLAKGTYQDHGARTSDFHLALKRSLPFISEQVMPYGKLGVGVSLGESHNAETTIMTTNVGPYYGAGILLKLTKRLSLYIEDSGIWVVPGGAMSFGSIN